MAVLFDVVLNPVEAFASLAVKPVWLLPLLLWSSLNLAANFVLLDKLDFGAIARNQVEQAGGYITEQQVDAVVAQSDRSRPVTLAVATLAPAAVTLLVATMFWLSLLAFGTMTSYRKAFAATTHAFAPQCIALLLTTLLTLRFGRIENLFDAGTILKSHLGVFATPQTSPPLMTVLQSLDVFSLWTVFLLGLGFAAVSGRSKRLTVALAYAFWAAYVVLKVGVIFFTFR